MIPRYNLSEPTEETARGAFERVLGNTQASALWQQARQALGLAAAPTLNLAQLRRVAAYLATQDGFVGVMGKSLLIRIETYVSLAGSDPSSRKAEAMP